MNLTTRQLNNIIKTSSDIATERTLEVLGRMGSDPSGRLSLRQRFVGSGVVNARPGVQGELYSRTEACDVIRYRTLVTETDGSGGGALPPISRDTIAKADPTSDALSLFRVVPVESDDIQIATQGTRTLDALPTAYNTAYPQSQIAWSKVPLATRDYGVFMTVTKGAWEDGTVAEAIREALDQEVRAEVEKDVLVGPGTGQNVTGILNTASVLTQARSTDPRITAIMKAAGQIRAASNENFGRDGLAVILSPTDAQTVALETFSGSAGYALEDAAASLALLNVRSFTVSPFLTAGTAIVCDPTKATIYSRTGINVSVAVDHQDHWILGLVDPLITWRAGFVVNFPKAFCLVTGM